MAVQLSRHRSHRGRVFLLHQHIFQKVIEDLMEFFRRYRRFRVSFCILGYNVILNLQFELFNQRHRLHRIQLYIISHVLRDARYQVERSRGCCLYLLGCLTPSLGLLLGHLINDMSTILAECLSCRSVRSQSASVDVWASGWVFLLEYLLFFAHLSTHLTRLHRCISVGSKIREVGTHRTADRQRRVRRLTFHGLVG